MFCRIISVFNHVIYTLTQCTHMPDLFNCRGLSVVFSFVVEAQTHTKAV